MLLNKLAVKCLFLTLQIYSSRDILLHKRHVTLSHAAAMQPEPFSVGLPQRKMTF